MQPQFLSHTQTVPPALVPRRGLGLFGAVGFVLAVLALAFTGGLVLWSKTVQAQAESVKKELADLKKNFEVDSIRQAEKVQNQIELGKKLLDSHIYPSQSFNFVELHTLDDVQITSFSYSNKKIQVGLLAPSFKTFAQQIRYYQQLQGKQISAFETQAPKLEATRGQVSFDVVITLAPCYINNQCPDKTSETVPAITLQEGTSTEEEL